MSASASVQIDRTTEQHAAHRHNTSQLSKREREEKLGRIARQGDIPEELDALMGIEVVVVTLSLWAVMLIEPRFVQERLTGKVLGQSR